jgi:alpha-N-arabinofuranosidase
MKTRKVAGVAGASALGVALMLSGSIVPAQAAEGDRPSITIEPEADIQPVSRDLFGANHRFGFNAFGTADPVTGAPDDALADAIADTGLTALRYPAGGMAQRFDFYASIGPQEKRGCQPGPEIPRTSEYGPDEHARLAERTGGTTDIVANFDTGTPQAAADWVEYMNSEVGANPNGGTDWAQIRAGNGHAEPYGVTYWELGNELDLSVSGNIWLRKLPEAERAHAYIYGATVPIVNETLVRGCDWRATASVSDGTAAQQLGLKWAPVVEDSQTVLVDGTAWTPVDDLSTAGPADQVYTIDATTGAVRFGDGVKGSMPAAGAKFTASYSTERPGFNEFYQAMKQSDPAIQVCSGFLSEEFVELMGDQNPYDCLVAHPYSMFRFGGWEPTNEIEAHDYSMYSADDYFLSEGEVGGFAVNGIRGWQDLIRESTGREDGPDMVITEWGILGASYPGSSHYLRSLDQGLYTASGLISFMDLGIPLANRHSLVDFDPDDANSPGSFGAPGASEMSLLGWAPSYVPSASALVMELFSKRTGDELVQSNVAANPSRTIAGLTYDTLQVATTRDEDGAIYLTVLNRDPESAVTADVNTGMQNATHTTAWTVTGPSVASYNSPEQPNAVALTKVELTVQPETFSYSFPARSVTSIQLTGAPEAPIPGGPETAPGAGGDGSDSAPFGEDRLAATGAAPVAAVGWISMAGLIMGAGLLLILRHKRRARQHQS